MRNQFIILSVFFFTSLNAAEVLNPDELQNDGPQNSETYRLPAVIVTATRTEEDSFDLPFVTETISSEQILQYDLPRTLPESLKEIPSVMVQKTAHGQGSPFIRGFTGFRTLLLIDGIRLNNSVFRDGPNQYWNTVDQLSVKQLELVKGPSSVLYGSDAIGGTVNAITKRREEFSEGFDWNQGVYYRGASAESSHIGRAEISGNAGEKWGFLVGASVKEFGDLRGGEDVGRQPKTGYSEFDWDAKAEYLVTPDSKLVFAHQSVDQDDAWRTHRTIFGMPWRGTTIGTDKKLEYDQNRDLSYVQYHAANLPAFVEEVHFSLSHQLQKEREFRIRSNDRKDRQGFDVNTLGASLQLQSPSPVGTWIYGTEYYRDSVDSFSRSFNADGTLASVGIQGPVGDDASYDLLGFFVEDNVPIGERLDVIFGGHYTYAAADANKVRDPVTGTQTSVSDNWDALAGSARILYRIDEQEHWNIFGGVSQGFRAPNLSDLTRFDIAASGELETASPNLKPEKFISYEAGIRTRYQRANAQVAYFYTMIDDLIVRTPTGNTIGTAMEVTKLNSGQGHVHGVEISGDWEFFPQWTGHGAFTWMEGRLETFPATSSIPVKQTEPLSRVMPITLQFGLKWDVLPEKFWVEGISTIVGRQDKLSSADQRDTQRIPPGGTPGYAVYTLRAGWRPCKNFTLSSAIENISNEDYRIHGSGLNELGRNFVIAADFRF